MYTCSRDLYISTPKLVNSNPHFIPNPQTPPHRLPFSTHSTPQHLKTLTPPYPISFKSKFGFQTPCHLDSHPNSPDQNAVPSLRNAASIGAATVASKILGLIREMTLASVFGVGPVVTAFRHASVLPGFCMSLLGGVNGPIHLTMATTLSKLSRPRGMKLVRNTNSLMFLVGVVVGGFVYVFAESIVYASAPGLWVLADGGITREIAVIQLKLMIPCVIFSGPVGVGYGWLSATRDDYLACISPALSSVFIIIFCMAYVAMRVSTNGALCGGILISCGASFGAFAQWIMHVIVHEHSQKNSVSVSWVEVLKDEDVREFFTLMLPAILTSGLAQIASFTDLYFASYIPFAAAGLSYAHLMAMAPLGLLSSVIILPLLPTFSESVKLMTWSSLMENINHAVILSMVIVLPIVSTMCVLAEPVIRILFRWSVFDPTASALVSSLFRCYSMGSPFYIIRELLVMVFYALGDSRRPFLISLASIVFNAFLDWLFVSVFSLGAPGLALATSLVNVLSVLMLFHLLSSKLTGRVDSIKMLHPLLKIAVCCVISGCITSVLYKLMQFLFSASSLFRFCILAEFFSVSLAGSLGICSFVLLTFICLPELKLKLLLSTLIDRMSHAKF